MKASQFESVLNVHRALSTDILLIIEYFWMLLGKRRRRFQTLSTAVHNILWINLHRRTTLSRRLFWHWKQLFTQASMVFNAFSDLRMGFFNVWQAFKTHVICSCLLVLSLNWLVLFYFFIRIVGSSRARLFLWITSHWDLISSTCCGPNHVGHTLLLLSCQQG